MSVGDFESAKNSRREQIAFLRELYDRTQMLTELEMRRKQNTLSSIEGLAAARKEMLDAVSMGNGTMANYEAERQGILDQIELTKIKLDQMKEQNRLLKETQALFGGQTDKIISNQAEQMKLNAQIISFEKTLRGIAAPNLIEQIIGAPQAILARLPSAAQLFYRAKNNIKEQMEGMSPKKGLGFNTYFMPQMFGGNQFMGMNGDNRFLGTKFNPSHVNPNLVSKINYKELYERGSLDGNNLVGEAAKINERANGAIQSQININPIINISVEDFEKQWDTKIAPRVREITISTFNQMKRANERGLSR
jgi:hypothetical protein